MMIPDSWTSGVAYEPIPSDDAAGAAIGMILTAETAAKIIAPWASAYLNSVTKLEVANKRTADIIKIVRDCEAR